MRNEYPLSTFANLALAVTPLLAVAVAIVSRAAGA